jgi:hypothetical protein
MIKKKGKRDETEKIAIIMALIVILHKQEKKGEKIIEISSLQKLFLPILLQTQKLNSILHFP